MAPRSTNNFISKPMNQLKLVLAMFILLLSFGVSYAQEETVPIYGDVTVGLFSTTTYSVNVGATVSIAQWHYGGGTMKSSTDFTLEMYWHTEGQYLLEYDLNSTSGVHYYGTLTVNVISYGPPMPTTLAATNITDNSFRANWTSENGATSYRVEIFTNPSNPSGSYVQGYSNFLSSTNSANITGLHFGTTYYYRVRSYNGIGFSQYSSDEGVTTTITLPTAPTVISPNYITSTAFNANWIASTSGMPVNYRLDVARDVNFIDVVHTNIAVYSTYYSITSLQPATTYYYRVRAQSMVGSSVNSGIMTVTTASPQSTDVFVQIEGPITVHLFETVTYNATFFKAGGGFGDPPPLQDANWIFPTPISKTDNSIVIEWSEPGTFYLEYDYYDTNNEHYNARIAITVINNGPPAPIATSATNITMGSFTANWTGSQGATSYLLDVISSGSFSINTGVYVSGYKNRVVNGTQESVIGLQQGTTYYYRVRAVNSSGISLPSGIDATTLGTPPKPVSKSATNIMANSFYANWYHILGENRNYEIDVATDNNFTNVVFQNTTTTNFLYINNLNDNTTYYYQVRALNNVGPSLNSEPVAVTTRPSPQAPLANQANSITSTSFIANWQPVVGSNYRLDVSEHANFSDYVSVYHQYSTNNTSVTVSGLIGGLTYYYQVRSVDQYGSSVNSNLITVVTLPAPPLTPTALAATNPTASSFTANWSNVKMATSYELDVSTSSTFANFLPGYHNFSTTSTSHNITGLVDKTTYYFRVRAVNNEGGSPYSNTILAVNLDENYIKSMDVKIKNVTSIEQLDILTSNQQTIQTAFFDGLGRPVQTIHKQGSPNNKHDIVQPVLYDQYGREIVQYLPFVSNESNGWLKRGVVDKDHPAYTSSDQYQFYQTTPNVAHDTNPFSEQRLESSPFGRVIKQGAPGAAWQPDGINGYGSTDHTIKFDYQTNSIEEVLLWSYFPPTIDHPLGSITAKNGNTTLYYPARQLYKNKTKDEQQHEVIEFKDKEGKVVLKKVQASNTEWAQTYYIYNNLGDLVIVLPPEAVKNIEIELGKTL